MSTAGPSAEHRAPPARQASVARTRGRVIYRRCIHETALLIRSWLLWPLVVLKPSRSFVYRGASYRYCYHPYGAAWMHERTVEIPIIWRCVEHALAAGKRVLEVGNTLSYYYHCRHDILDKYDVWGKPEVINQDVVDFQPAHRYDLIVSISTLEHVGWDEDRDPTKFLRAVANLKRCLAPGGALVVTIPLGYNPEVDALAKAGHLPFDDVAYLERVSSSNRWRETTRLTWKRYPLPFPSIRTIAIGMDSAAH